MTNPVQKLPTSRIGLKGVVCTVCMSFACLITGTQLSGQSTPQLTAGQQTHSKSNGALQGPDFVIRHWYVEDGLPHNVINDVARDSRGYLWIGTNAGLARFDGRFFSDYPVPSELTRNRYNIRAIAIEDDQTIVVITGANRLLRLRNGKYEVHPADEFVNDVTLRDLAIDATGALWIGSDAPAIMRWDGKRVERFGSEAGVTPRDGAYCFVTDKNKRTWISGRDLLGWYEDGRIKRYEPPVPAKGAVLITESHLGGLWIATRDYLAKLENGTFNIILSGDDWPGTRIRIPAIHETQAGVLWVGTRNNGAYQLVAGKLKPVSLGFDEILAINDDIDGNIWLGANGGGLVRLKPSHHVLLDTSAGLHMDASTSVTEDETGALWCANQSNAVRLKNGTMNIAMISADEPLPNVTNVSADQQGKIWIGTFDGLFFTTSEGNNGTWRAQKYEKPMNVVQTLFCARNGDLWVSWNNGHLARIRDGDFREYTPAEGIPGGRISGGRIVSVTERQAQGGVEIWVALERGQLFRLRANANAFEEITLLPDEHATPIHALHVDNENRLWLGTVRGLILWREEGIKLFTTAEGLPDDIIDQVISDNHDRLWLASRRGIFFVPLKQLIAALERPAAKVTATLLGRDDNLDGLIGTLRTQPRTWRGNNGRLWFATYRGIVGFNATDMAGDIKRKHPVYIDGLAVNGAPLELPTANSSAAPVRIDPQPRQIEIAFAALGFSAPEYTRVRRMLEGADVDWIDATGERTCIYSRLAPGKYTFRIEATDTSDNTQREQTSLVIEVDAAWWQTKWFRIAVVLLILIGVGWCVRHVSNRILKQRLRRLEEEQALNRERARIASDLHDDLGTRASQISFVADRVYRQVSDPQLKEIVGRLLKHARGLVEDLHRIVWTVNPENDSWQRLADYITLHAQRHFSDTGIICTIEGAETIPDAPVSPDIQHHLLAITKETLGNMLKHSRADHVTIQLSAETGRFRMVVRDNGCGFDTTNIGGFKGNGLKNMRRRIAEIGGNLEINSRIGEGTKFVIDIAL